eukprot:6621427-Prymnesium_polylepis.1
MGLHTTSRGGPLYGRLLADGGGLGVTIHDTHTRTVTAVRLAPAHRAAAVESEEDKPGDGDGDGEGRGDEEEGEELTVDQECATCRLCAHATKELDDADDVGHRACHDQGVGGTSSMDGWTGGRLVDGWDTGHATHAACGAVPAWHTCVRRPGEADDEEDGEEDGGDALDEGGDRLEDGVAGEGEDQVEAREEHLPTRRRRERFSGRAETGRHGARGVGVGRECDGRKGRVP